MSGLRGFPQALPDEKSRDGPLPGSGGDLRAGAGLYVADKMLEGLVNVVGSGEKAERAGKEFVGEYLGSFAVPLQQLRDLKYMRD